MSDIERSAERLLEPRLERFDASELPILVRAKNEWGTTSMQFENGDELLDSLLLHSRVVDYSYPILDPDLDQEIYPESSTVSRLNIALVSHVIKGTFLYESKLKFDDQAAIQAVRVLVSLGENYEFDKDIEGLEEIVEMSVKEKKIFRTKSLLEDLNEHFANLRYSDIWFKVHSGNEGIVRAAKLVGFTLHGQGDHTAIEPIVEVDGKVGLLPEDVSTDPYVSFRLDSKNPLIF